MLQSLTLSTSLHRNFHHPQIKEEENLLEREKDQIVTLFAIHCIVYLLLLYYLTLVLMLINATNPLIMYHTNHLYILSLKLTNLISLPTYYKLFFPHPRFHVSINDFKNHIP